MSKPETVWYDVSELSETDLAYFFEIEGDEMWIPKSQLKARKKEDGKIVRVELTTWIAEQKGLYDSQDEQ